MSSIQHPTTNKIEALRLQIPAGSIAEIDLNGQITTIRIAAVIINNENNRVRIQPAVRQFVMYIEFAIAGVNGEAKIDEITVGLRNEDAQACREQNISFIMRRQGPNGKSQNEIVSLCEYLNRGE